MSGSAPSSLPTWATNAGTKIEPTSGKKAAGWVAAEKPPARWFNWWMNIVYQWIYYYGSKNVAGGVAGIDDTDGSIKFTNATTNKPAIDVTGNGTAAGIVGTGGSSNGDGIHGNAVGIGIGLVGNSSNTSSSIGVVGNGNIAANTTGVQGNGYGSGVGVEGISNGSGEAVRATASNASDGLVATASAGSQAAVRGTGSSAAGGVWGFSTGSGTAVQATNNSTGYALVVSGKSGASPTYAPINVVPTQAPTSANNGDMYIDSSTGKLKIRVLGNWETVTSA